MEPRQILYAKGYIISDTGSTNCLGSYCIAILQNLSQKLSCQLDFENLPSHLYSKEWDDLTCGILDIKSKPQFLAKITQLIFNPEDVEFKCQAQKIRTCIQDYFGSTLDVNILQDLSEFPFTSNPQSVKGQVLLFKQGNLFCPILLRADLYPDPDTFAQSIIKDIRDQSIFTPFFKTMVGVEGDIFKMQILIRNILSQIQSCDSIPQLLDTLSINDELQYGLIFQLLGCEKKLSPTTKSAIILELKTEIAMALHFSVQQFILEARDSSKTEASDAAIDAEDFSVLCTEAEETLVQEEEKLAKLNDSKIEREEILQRVKELQKADCLNRLKSRISTTTPINSWKQVDSLAQQIFEWYPEFKDDEAELQIKTWNSTEITDMKSYLASQVKIIPTLDPNNHRHLILQSNHLSVKLCLEHMRTFLESFSQADREETLQINLVGHESISIDSNLTDQLFHGVNISFAAKEIHVGSGLNDVMTINVSGLNGQEHSSSKPPTPTASGTRGADGLHGNPGESGGNVFFYAAKRLKGLKFLEIISNGGNGSRGQDAGDGSNGRHGEPGPDGIVSATHPTAPDVRHEYGEGKRGTVGRDGGSSGRIGRGGLGGQEGFVNIQLGSEILSYTCEPSSSFVPGNKIQDISVKNKIGQPGENGNFGQPGAEGKGGKHGKDRAWVTESAWWFDPWTNPSGRLKLNYHNGWFKKGYTAEQLPFWPDATDGTGGHDTREFNTTELKASNPKKPISINSLITNSTTVRESASILNNLTDMSLLSEDEQKVMEISRNLKKQQQNVDEAKQIVTSYEQSIKRTKEVEMKCEAKSMECVNLSKILTEEFDQFKQEMRSLSLQQQQQRQSYQITDSSHHHQLQSTSSAHRSIQNVSNQVDKLLVEHFESSTTLQSLVTSTLQVDHLSYETILAFESFLQTFLKHFDDLPDGVHQVLLDLKERVSSNQTTFGGFGMSDFIANIYPKACVEFKSYPGAKLMSHPLLGDEVADADVFLVLYNLFGQSADKSKLVECEKFLYTNQDMTIPQKVILLNLLEPKILELYIPKLVKALRAKPSGMVKQMKDMAYKTYEYYLNEANPKGSKVGKQITVEERNVCKELAQKVLKSQRKLQGKKPEKMKYSALTLMAETEKLLTTTKDFEAEDYIDRIFVGILHNTVDSMITGLKNPMPELPKFFHKCEFIIENFAYPLEKLDEIAQTEATLGNKGLAAKLKEAVQMVYIDRFQDDVLKQIFHNLKETQMISNDESVDEMRSELVEILALVNSYQQRHEHYKDFLDQTLTADFSWYMAVEKLKLDICGIDPASNLQHGELLERLLDQANDNFDSSTKEFKNWDLLTNLLNELHPLLKFSKMKMDNLQRIEDRMLQLMQNVIGSVGPRSNLDPVSVNAMLAQFCVLQGNLVPFWDRQLTSNLLEPIRSKFDKSKYDECTTGVEKFAEELVNSTKIYQKEEYIGYLNLKLAQLKYWALHDGRYGKFKALCDKVGSQSLQDDTERDEIQSMTRILEALNNFVIPPIDLQTKLTTREVEPDQLKIVKTFEDRLKGFLKPATPSTKDVIGLVDAIIALTAIKCIQTIDIILSAAEVHLVKEWKHDTNLFQFLPPEEDNPTIKNSVDDDAISQKLATALSTIIKRTKGHDELRRLLKNLVKLITAVLKNEHEILLEVITERTTELAENTTATLAKLEVKCKERMQLLIVSQSQLMTTDQWGKILISTYLERCDLQLLQGDIPASRGILQVEQDCFLHALKLDYFPNKEEFENQPGRFLTDLAKQTDTIQTSNQLKALLSIPDTFVHIIQSMISNLETFKKAPKKTRSESLLCLEKDLTEICEQKSDKRILKSFKLLQLSQIFCSIKEEEQEFMKVRIFWEIKTNSMKIASNQHFWETCRSTFNKIKSENRTISLNEFLDFYFEPNTSTATRILLSRILQKMQVDSTPDFSSLVHAFMTQRPNPVLSPDEIVILQNLLTPGEKCYLQKSKSPIEALMGSTDWLQEFQHHFVQTLFQELSLKQPENLKKQLGDLLTKWSSQFHKSEDEDFGHYEHWVHLLEKFVRLIKLLPIPYEAVVKFLEIAASQDIQFLEGIIDNRLPLNYVQAALFLMLRENFLKRFKSEDQVDKIIRKLQEFTFRKSGSKVERFLEFVVNQTSDLFQIVPDAEFFLKIATDDEFVKGDEELLVKLSTAYFNQWEGLLLASFYLKKYQFTSGHIIHLILDVEAKFKSHTADFVAFLVNDKKISEEELVGFMQSLKNGRWILNGKVLSLLTQQFKADPKLDVETALDEFMKTVGDVQGADLVDAIVNLQINQANDDMKKGQKALLEDLSSIHEKYKGYSISVLSNEATSIADWDKEQLKLWSTTIKQKSKAPQAKVATTFKIEILAVICQAVKLFTTTTDTPGYIPRDTQLASVLLFLSGKDKQIGRFGEIATSEGKTLISTILAIVLALDGKNVDVITSSPVLANDAFEEMKELFRLLGISASTICDGKCRKGGNAEQVLKGRYGQQVLYGDVASYQTDFLYNSYLGKKYTRDRRADFLIVDEVDSMLLDKGSHVLYISHNIPELRSLRKIFIDIWANVKSNVPKTEIERKIKAKFMGKSLTFPRFLLPFVKERIPIWINNAFSALEIKKDDPYVLSQGTSGEGSKVTIIDLDTGVEQESMQYSYGLHQFLQLKHGNKISAESLKAIFVSNLGYFRKFQGRIFGITGTMGSEYSRGFLKKLYNVDFFKMPRYKYKHCTKLPALFERGDDAFLKAILQTIEENSTTKPTLIICPNVEQAKKVEDHLNSKLDPERRKQIFPYFSSYEDLKEQLKDKPLSAGDIIISTNLAGRGTDLEIDGNCKSGLHVILTYIPGNRRVEKQAFGRTARAGKSGSTQYIISIPEGFNQNQDIKVYQDQMDLAEDTRLQRVAEREVPQIEFEEFLFNKFFTRLESLNSTVGNKVKFLQKVNFVTQLAANSIISSPEEVRKAKLKVIQNRWAFWLDGIQHCIQKMHLPIGQQLKKNIQKEFEVFWSDLMKDYTDNLRLGKSPSDFVKLAKAYEDNQMLGTMENILSHGIHSEPEFNEICHYYKAVSLLKRDSQTKSINTRKDARKHLKISHTKLQSRIQSLHEELLKFTLVQKICGSTVKQNLSQIENASETKEPGSNFSEQIDNEIKLLGFHEQDFISPALGYPFNLDSFLHLTLVNQDEKEAEELFQAIEAHTENILKPTRVSKKVTLNADGTLQFNGSPLSFDGSELKMYETRIPSILRSSIQKTCRSIDTNDFKQVAVTRTAFWTELKEAGFIEKDQSYTILEVNYDEDKFAEECCNFVIERKIFIGKMLADNNLQPFKVDLLTEFPQEQENIVKELERLGHLVKRTYFKGEITAEAFKELYVSTGGKLAGLPQRLTNYESILKPWICVHSTCGEQTVPVKQVDTKSLVSLPHEQEFETCDMIKQLQALGIIKETKVNWSLSKNFKKEDARRKAITSQFKPTSKTAAITELKKIFMKYHPDDKDNQEVFKTYLKQIRKELIRSVGEVKTLPELKVDKKYKSIAEYYSTGSRPPEIFDLINEDFDRIPKIARKVPWWSNGAFYVTILGVLQIALGVTVGVLSYGSLANVSMMLISEGGSDIMFAIQGGLTGDFLWKSYGIHKAFSVGASILTGGLAGMTGASLAINMFMEVGEEILKKVAWTVGRYALQGLGSTLLNMSIEKALDWTRNSVLSQIRNMFSVSIKVDEQYVAAKNRLRQSLHNLHSQTYRLDQAETIAKNARIELGTGNAHSAASNALLNAVQRVLSFYTSKLTDKLTEAFGKGLVGNVTKLIKFLSVISPLTLIKVKEAIKTFALGYVNQLSSHFDSQAEKLKAKREVRITSVQRVSSAKFEEFTDVYLDEIESGIAEDGLSKFQQEFAEPALKQMGNRLLESTCHKLFSSRHADFSNHKSFTGLKSEGNSFWKPLTSLTTPSVHYSVENSSRRDDNDSRNNVWDDISFSSAFSPFRERLDALGQYFQIGVDSSTGELTGYFELSGDSKGLLQEAERLGVTIVRRFVL